MQLVNYVAKHAFQGDAGADQLSFRAGDVVEVDVHHRGGGWAWGSLANDPSRWGWCPQSYLVPEATRVAPPPATAAPPAPVDDEGAPPSFDFSDFGGGVVDDDGGFGPVMGGTAAAAAAPTEDAFRTTSTPHYASSDRSAYSARYAHAGTPYGGATSSDRPTASVWDAFSGIGSGVRSVGAKSAAAIADGARRGGELAAKAAEETKYRVQDTSDQRSDARNNRGRPANAHGRTEGEQRKLDAANGAAHGAVAGGAYGAVHAAVFGGGIDRVKRDAVGGAAVGGAHGFVKNWKPFGK